ncbi:hypothetical protein [Terriglobus sp. RCC_193]|uniref:hypothetical protein n=1 Tax=Terriglobus sp. RCC_193 TaxID=3239218 RepID=UPI003526AAA6
MSDIILGRPDFRDPAFGWTNAKSFPPYVHGTGGNAHLMHRTAGVKMYWYRATYDSLIRLDSPERMIAETVCGMSFFLHSKRGRTCTLPQRDAVLCGRCHGSTPTFSRKYPQPVTPEEARLRLGCAMEGSAA